jgi:GTPase SAR1 family protein
MNKIRIIIGLPGSGKSALVHKINENIHNTVFSDWGWKNEIDDDGNILGSFDEEYRINDLTNRVKKSENIIIDGSCFCNHKFICDTEYYFNLNFPNIEIEKIYFENNPKDCTANVLYREYVGGSGWKNINGEFMFVGHHYYEEGPNKGRRMYEVIIENINKLSKNYIIPYRYNTKKVELQDEKFYQGWESLIRE